MINHFEDKEFWCKCGRPTCDAPNVPHIDMLNKLNLLRDIVKMPLIITSGYRCDYWNRLQGGEKDSEHLTGEAVDVACASSYIRMLLIEHALRIGIKRLGMGPNFIHIGISKDHPQSVMWTYYPKLVTV